MVGSGSAAFRGQQVKIRVARLTELIFTWAPSQPTSADAEVFELIKGLHH